MKRTGFFSLVLLALVFTVFMAEPASALDHPWDGTKVIDTLSNGQSGNPENGGNDNDSGGGLLGFFSDLMNWVIGSEKQDAEQTERKNDKVEVRETFKAKDLSKEKKY